MPHEHPVAAVALINHKIVIAGGNGGNNNSVDIYDLATDTWHAAELSDSRYNISVAVGTNKVIFLGGSYSSNVDIYDAVTDTWSVTHLNVGVTGVTAASIGNRCLFTGFLYDGGSAETSIILMIEP